jgi:Protein of unknown function (DUF1566)
VSAWDTKINTGRFKVLQDFNNEAVLDKETGLVWEKQPSNNALAWPNARLFCAQKGVGGRGGWRLPSFYELASLIDPAVQVGPQLPSGHPFLQVQAAPYWTDTQFAEEPGFVLVVDFQFVIATAGQIQVNDANSAGAPKFAWAVRGPCAGPNSY